MFARPGRTRPPPSLSAWRNRELVTSVLLSVVTPARLLRASGVLAVRRTEYSVTRVPSLLLSKGLTGGYASIVNQAHLFKFLSPGLPLAGGGSNFQCVAIDGDF